ncbi:protein piwi [Episyrphus balteatus]|nr:protein piwi [Episyrphus balteatus]XP_055839654.1 protein piwi [Episyrphus balteatus]XP_055839655.1 protein piwi [Episyrphus balteatus]
MSDSQSRGRRTSSEESRDREYAGSRRPRSTLSPTREEEPRKKIQKRSSPGEGPSTSSSSRSHERHEKSNRRERSEHSDRSERHERSSSSVAQSVSRPPGAKAEGGRRDRLCRYEIVHTRPQEIDSKCGRSGAPISLQANYFRLLTTPTWRIYQYHVDFSPDIELRRVRGGILSEHKGLFGGYIYDGMKMFSTTKLREDLIKLETTSKSGEKYMITVKYVGVISMKEWQSLQILNLILRRAMEGLKLQLVGRNFFDAVAKIDLREHRMQLWPGYQTSIRQHEQDILLCTEITHKVMRTETVYDILMKCTQESRDFQENFKKHVLGLTVLTDYNNKTYRINDIDFAANPKKTFKCKEKDMSFIDYYYQKYKIRIRDAKQPLLISKSKDRQIRGGNDEFVILIPELCRATGLTDTMRSNFQLMRAMADHTRMNPDRRIERLRVFNRRLLETESSVKVLSDWNMKLDRNMVEIKGRVLEPQNIVFFDKRKVTAGEQADWTRSFRDNAMFTTPSRGLDRWAVVAPNRSSRDVRNFVDSLIRAASGMQFQIRRPRENLIFDDRNHSYVKAIEDCANDDPQLILCLVPNNNADRYGSIKKKSCVERAIPTQVITHKTATNQRGLMSVATKVAIQINCKLGYAPWMIELPLSGLMTIGYDIARATRDKSKAYGALVASMDMKTNATFYSTVSPCHSADSLSNELTISVMKALKQYQREHEKLPARILMYRDGVGEGSLNQLVEHEVKELVSKLEKIYKDQSDKPLMFAYIVVSKQINTRFFARGRNPPPGTVVDDVITLPERYDFYLVSQSVRQGTVSPTCYNVVYSNIKLTPDQLQVLTYKMTHLYYNWSGTTRVPAVCQYAKKLATLVSQNIFQVPSNALEKKLYYL